MIIKYKNYKLIPDEDRFTLVETVTATKKDSDETYPKDNNKGYGFTFESGIKKITLLELAKDETEVNINEFVKEFEKMYNNVKLNLE